MEKKIEKQKFYISEFQEEAAWLSFMHREGWKFITTNGHKYEFEKCEGEDWIYQLDFKENGVAEEDYIQIFKDYGWEYVGQFRRWFYFRKKKTEDSENDMSIFSDNESKIEMCKRVINGNIINFIPFLLIIIAYDFLVGFTKLFRGDGVLSIIVSVFAIITLLIAVFALSFVVGQYSRLNHMIKKMQNPVMDIKKI